MRILFDQGTPAPLRKSLAGHNVRTCYELGWSTMKNGELLRAAEAQFDLLVTADRNLKHEQNLTGRRLAILVLPFTSWPRLQSHTEKISEAINEASPGDYIEIVLD